MLKTFGSVCAAFAIFASGAAPALASSSANVEHFIISFAGTHLAVVAHGPVGGGGKVVIKGNDQILHLGGGTLTLRTDPKTLKATGSVNPKTCYASFRVSNSYTLGHGSNAR